MHACSVPHSRVYIYICVCMYKRTYLRGAEDELPGEAPGLPVDRPVRHRPGGSLLLFLGSWVNVRGVKRMCVNRQDRSVGRLVGWWIGWLVSQLTCTVHTHARTHQQSGPSSTDVIASMAAVPACSHESLG